MNPPYWYSFSFFFQPPLAFESEKSYKNQQDLFAENDRVLQLVTVFVNYGKFSLNPESSFPRLDKDSPLSFYDDVLVEILCLIIFGLLITEPQKNLCSNYKENIDEYGCGFFRYIA